MKRGEIEFTWGDEQLEASCKRADITTSSVTTYNHIRAEHLKPGTFIVDDSQPPSVLREEAEKASAYVFWVVGHLPGIERTFALYCGESATIETQEVALLRMGWKKITYPFFITPERTSNIEQMHTSFLDLL